MGTEKGTRTCDHGLFRRPRSVKARARGAGKQNQSLKQHKKPKCVGNIGVYRSTGWFLRFSVSGNNPSHSHEIQLLTCLTYFCSLRIKILSTAASTSKAPCMHWNCQRKSASQTAWYIGYAFYFFSRRIGAVTSLDATRANSRWRLHRIEYSNTIRSVSSCTSVHVRNLK